MNSFIRSVMVRRCALARSFRRSICVSSRIRVVLATQIYVISQHKSVNQGRVATSACRRVVAPAPNLYHQTISGNLEFVFRSYLEQNPLGILLHGPVDVVFHTESIWQPDIIIVLNANRHILKQQRCEKNRLRATRRHRILDYRSGRERNVDRLTRPIQFLQCSPPTRSGLAHSRGASFRLSPCFRWNRYGEAKARAHRARADRDRDS